MKIRKAISKAVENEVLLSCERRCCLCFGLQQLDVQRRGQIAHLDRDSSNPSFDNLVFLCLEHHDEYDSITSQSKGFSLAEVKTYRDRLYAYKGTFPSKAKIQQLDEQVELAPLPPTSEYEEVRRKHPRDIERIDLPWRSGSWQIANEPELFAYKANNSFDGVCLIERIDLPDGRIAIACIDIAGNPGQSITNSIENICFQVCERFEIPAKHLIWLEHYDYFEDDEWNVVQFATVPPQGPFTDPKWTKMTPEMWAALRMSPRSRLDHIVGQYRSKLKKHFAWPDGPIL